MTFLYLGLGSFILGIVLLIYYPIHNAQNKRRSERTEGTITKSNIILYVGLACIAVAVISIFLFIHSL